MLNIDADSICNAKESVSVVELKAFINLVSHLDTMLDGFFI